MWQYKSWVSAMQLFSSNKTCTDACIVFLTEDKFWVKVSIRPVSVQVLMSGVPSFSFCELCILIFYETAVWMQNAKVKCKR